MDRHLADAVIALVERAGTAIMDVYRTDFDVQTKDDASPLTRADLAAHNIIARGLAELTPEIPLFSEESAVPEFSRRQGWTRYWLVDPLDGTREFVNRNDEFTVNIALIDDHKPVFGVVGVPAQGVVYTGIPGQGAFRHASGTRSEIGGCRRDESAPLVVVASRSHGGERLERYLAALAAEFGAVERTPVGSSLKLCILAEGRADLYPRLGPTSEWDIAAAHAVLAAAGGRVWAADGSALEYNRKDSVLNPEFFAVADAAYPWERRLPAVSAAD
ncbi:MAG: 3'(2'),5'-bisphosphate nucleotidase CysQ [Pseudomonadales bacterium]|nr:3'(2'),5'-bisphosphate nucleotidase CysQ [Pseudomonadales bacterium]